MTERKPGTMSFESWIEAQIRDAQDRGEFDDLPGRGKPLQGLDGAHDDLWWVKQWMRREGLSYLPPALAIRREAEKVLEDIGRLSSERAVRRVVDDLNERIRDVNRRPAIDGPPSTLMPLDLETVVARWRATTAAQDGDDDGCDAGTTTPVPDQPAAAPRRRRWRPRSRH
jgi:hypothetical protein